MLAIASVNPCLKIACKFIHILVLTSLPPLRKLGSIETQTTHRGVQMKAPYYIVKAEVKKFWFNPSRIIYVLEEHGEVLVYPSCGAGAGDYRTFTKAIIDKSEDLDFIQDLCNTLNKYNGEVK